MAYKNFNNPVTVSKNIINGFLKPSMVVCDCTCGNGHDTLLLSNLVGEDGRVYGFDIQDLAINNTRERLSKFGKYDNLFLFKESHEKIDECIEEPLDLIIYNLGYLPGGDKTIKTTESSSLNSISKSLKKLKANGILLVTCYTGHEGGLEEQLEVKKLFENLEQKQYNVIEFKFLNQKNNPPILYGVEKNNI